MTEMVSAMKRTYNDIHYEWFDFHKECAGMKYENLSRLIAKVKGELQQWGHFICSIQGGLDKRQEIPLDQI